MASEPQLSIPTPEPVAPAAAPRRRGVGSGPVIVLALVMGLLGGLAGGYLAGTRFERSPASGPGPVRISVPVTNRLTEESAIIDVAAKAGPAVVEIQTRFVDRDPLAFGQPPAGIGSGFIVDPTGYIVTNNHVIANGRQLKVKVRDSKTQFDAHVVGTDREDDIAVIKIDAKNLPTLSFGDSHALKVGQLAIAIGSPLGRQNSVSRGVISALHRSLKVRSPDGIGEVTILNAIQTDAIINPGNSGGPLLDSAGQVIGVNFAIEQAQAGAGLSYALDGNSAREIADQLIRTGRVIKPVLGISYQPLDETAASALNRPVGALVREIGPGTPADRAGLKVNDVITQVNDLTVDDDHPLGDLLRQFRAGDRVTLSVQRADKRVTIPVTLGPAAA